MTGQEYIEIFKENNLHRSKLVILIESQIPVLAKAGMNDLAEETKWLAFMLAEEEKKQGYYFLGA